MHGEVIITEKYKKKISETQKKPATGAKQKRKKRNKPTKPQKNQKKSFEQRLRELTKFSVDESNSDANSTDDGNAVETSKNKEQNESILQLNNYEGVWENDSMPAVFSANQLKPVNESTSLSVLSQLDDQNIGKYCAAY